MPFDELFDDEALEYFVYDEITNAEWRDEYEFNDYGLDPYNYDSLEEFLDAYNDAKEQRLEDEEYDEEW